MSKPEFKVVLIIPYFGEWPDYFPLFLKGCASNTWMDVFFFTDCQPPAENYPNVFFHLSTLGQFSHLASEKLGFPVQVSCPYKLCDFKALYGKIYEDEIKGYDYWAYGDIDLIYGDLKPSVYPRLEQGFDILSFREEIVSGSLVILKNDPDINYLQRTLPDLPELLNDKTHLSLTETCFVHTTWQGQPKSDLPKHSYTYMVDALSRSGKLKASFVTACKEFIYPGEVIRYKGEKLVCGEEEFAYYHLVCHKSKAEFKMPKWTSVPEEFYITNTGFYTVDQYRVLPMIHSIRKLRGLVKRGSRKIRKILIDG
jgi:hypothetical protein